MKALLTVTVLAALLPGVAGAQQLRKPSEAASQEAMKTMRNGIRLDQPVGPPASSPSGGGGPVISTLTNDDLLAIAKEIGLEEARADTTDSKEPYVAGKSNGLAVEFTPFECKDGCEAVAFNCYFGRQDDVDAKFTNAYNAAKIAKLVKYENGNLVLEYAIKLYGGVTREHVKQMAAVFLTAIKGAIDFKPS